MLGVVTATVDRARAEPCLQSWIVHAAGSFPLTVVEKPEHAGYCGPVTAFHTGVSTVLREVSDCDLIACLHDDLVIFDFGWDRAVIEAFEADPSIGLVGFAGVTQLGTDAIYHERGGYRSDQLARQGYRSNSTDAEAHGLRSLEAEPVVCLASFSLIGRRAFWCGFTQQEWQTHGSRRQQFPRPWTVIDDLGIVDHWYDGALACLARRGGWTLRYLPVRCRHLGGQTTQHDPGYVAWADAQIEGGDRGIWEAAHRIGYENFRDVLPLRL